MFEILTYNKNLETRWDRFVTQESMNGTFLQTRRFLNYHPEGRFRDASFALEASGTIIAAFPGVLNTDGEWVSHPGSTFGGPIISRHFYTAERLANIIDSAEQHLKTIAKKIKIRPTSNLFAQESTALLEYIFEHKGYRRQSELSIFCDLDKKTDPLEKCEKNCRAIFRKSSPFNLELRDLTDEELPIFYKHLCISKQKFNTKPVHTLEELLDLRHNRISEEIRFRGLWMDNTYVAGMMMFEFKKTNVLHAQYIATNNEIKQFQPATAMYISAMREAAKDGFGKMSWGISTENCGEYLNLSLFKFKESFGGRPTVNLIYTKEF